MNKTPLQQINERFGSKEKLVKELQKMFDKGDFLIEKLNSDKGLASVANAKLIKLYDTVATVKSQFKSRDLLIDELLKKMNRIKDKDLKTKFEDWGLPRLWDYYKSIAKKADKK